MKVRGDDGVDGLGLQGHAAGHCVDEHFVRLDIWVIFRYERVDFVP